MFVCSIDDSLIELYIHFSMAGDGVGVSRPAKKTKHNG